jgi:uncharacterized membrane protein
MTRLSALWIAALAVTISACTVGEVASGNPDGGGSGTGGGGGQSFNAMIAPLVTRCTGCHSSGTPPNLSSFSMLQAKYKMKPGASNVLATKGDHQSITYLTTQERATVAAWIDSLP